MFSKSSVCTTRYSDVSFVPLQLATVCVQCELISENHTPHCLACGSKAVLSLSRVLGGSLRGHSTATLITDEAINSLVRDLLRAVPEVEPAYGMGPMARVGTVAQRSQLRVANASHPSAAFYAVSPSDDHEIQAAELDLEPAISAITDRAQQLTGATGAAIGLRRGDEIVCRARVGRTAPDLGMRLQTETGISAECVRTGETMLCHDAERSPHVDPTTRRQLGVRSILASPLRHHRRTLGVFEVLSSSPGAFDQKDVATMQLLSSVMVAAISRIASRKMARPAPLAG
jgi:putative methionine-R-sulfoxide reductase with GAF domain